MDIKSPTHDGGGVLKDARAPSLAEIQKGNVPSSAPPPASPTPPVEQIINPTPTAPRLPTPPQTPAPRAANDPVPVVTPSPKAPEPAPQPAVASGDMLIPVMDQDGKQVLMPLSTVQKEVKLGRRLEHQLSQQGRREAEFAREAELGRVILAHKHNPQQLNARLAEMLGIPLEAENTATADDGLDPAQKALDARLKRLEGHLMQQGAEQRATTLQTEIRNELQKYPLFSKDGGELQAAEIVVAANIHQGALQPENAPAFIAKWHQDRHDAITRLTTLERDQRVENATVHATVPASAATPGLTANDPPSLSAKDIQRNAGDAFRRASAAIWDKIKP